MSASLMLFSMQIDVLNDSKEIALSIYCNSAILAIVIIVSVVLEENLTIYGAVYAYGVAISTTAILIIVFFTKVCGTCYSIFCPTHGFTPNRCLLYILVQPIFVINNYSAQC